MSNTWTETARPGYRTKTIQRGAATIIIHRPILDEAAAARAERQAADALAAALRNYNSKQ